MRRLRRKLAGNACIYSLISIPNSISHRRRGRRRWHRRRWIQFSPTRTVLLKKAGPLAPPLPNPSTSTSIQSNLILHRWSPCQSQQPPSKNQPPSIFQFLCWQLNFRPTWTDQACLRIHWQSFYFISNKTFF